MPLSPSRESTALTTASAVPIKIIVTLKVCHDSLRELGKIAASMPSSSPPMVRVEIGTISKELLVEKTRGLRQAIQQFCIKRLEDWFQSENYQSLRAHFTLNDLLQVTGIKNPKSSLHYLILGAQHSDPSRFSYSSVDPKKQLELMNRLISHGAQFDQIEVLAPVGSYHCGEIKDESTWKSIPFHELFLRSNVVRPSKETQMMYLKAKPSIINKYDGPWPVETTFGYEHYSSASQETLFTVREESHRTPITDTLENLKSYFKKTSINGLYHAKLPFSFNDLELLDIEIRWYDNKPWISDPNPANNLDIQIDQTETFLKKIENGDLDHLPPQILGYFSNPNKDLLIITKDSLLRDLHSHLNDLHERKIVTKIKNSFQIIDEYIGTFRRKYVQYSPKFDRIPNCCSGICISKFLLAPGANPSYTYSYYNASGMSSLSVAPILTAEDLLRFSVLKSNK